ncbi:MAG: hypothetical protein RIR96_983, partial [Bacteroidota bacterium]
MEKTEWKVTGMTCSNCALSVTRFLQGKGMYDVSVNPLDGQVHFINSNSTSEEILKKGIEQLGYEVLENGSEISISEKHSSKNKIRFFITLPFTLILMLHMLHPWVALHFLMNGWIQLALCLPVFLLGMYHFGKSAWSSLLSGVPNMNVLVALGALVSFIYSLSGLLIFHDSDYYFFETTASIITLVLFGNYLEEKTVRATRSALDSLLVRQKVMANMIAFDDKYQEQVFPVESVNLRTGDLILINSGEQVPSDCKILWGECLVNESLLTGESLPISKQKKDILIGGSILESGTVKAQVTATGENTVLAGIVKLIRNAQQSKPKLQQLADRISAIFVPLVIVLAFICFGLNYWVASVSLSQSIMRSIAMLVISCPCAMGLATPAAIAVGLGRGAKNGILYTQPDILEQFKKIKQIVFDKTGTLTTGRFEIHQFKTDMPILEFQNLVASLEKHSSHPLATSISRQWTITTPIHWKKTEEIKGMGIMAEDKDGNIFELGSAKMNQLALPKESHSMYLWKNKVLQGWIDMRDEWRPEAKSVIDFFRERNIKTILITGDTAEKAAIAASELGIEEFHAGFSPQEKCDKIESLNQIAPTIMVGDGINDAPALAKATIGISLSDASQLAIQHSAVVLMKQGLSRLPEAFGLGRH